MLDKAAKNELPEDVPDDLSNLIIDRDTCMASVVGSHDIHIGKLLAREDETRAAETRGMATVIDGYVNCALLCSTHVCNACSLIQYSCCGSSARACSTGRCSAICDGMVVVSVRA